MEDDDPTLDSLEELVLVGRQNIANWLGLMTRVDRVRELRREGVAYRDMHIEEGMPIIDAISTNQDRLTVAAARFRRATAHALASEGLSPSAIARLFGVSRQRVASLLAGADAHSDESKPDSAEAEADADAAPVGPQQPLTP